MTILESTSGKYFLEETLTSTLVISSKSVAYESISKMVQIMVYLPDYLSPALSSPLFCFLVCTSYNGFHSKPHLKMTQQAT